MQAKEAIRGQDFSQNWPFERKSLFEAVSGFAGKPGVQDCKPKSLNHLKLLKYSNKVLGMKSNLWNKGTSLSNAQAENLQNPGSQAFTLDRIQERKQPDPNHHFPSDSEGCEESDHLSKASLLKLETGSPDSPLPKPRSGQTAVRSNGPNEKLNQTNKQAVALQHRTKDLHIFRGKVSS